MGQDSALGLLDLPPGLLLSFLAGDCSGKSYDFKTLRSREPHFLLEVPRQQENTRRVWKSLKKFRVQQRGKALPQEQPKTSFHIKLTPPQPFTPSTPSSPIPVQLCPLIPKEAAHGLFPVLVLILVPASQQAPCGKAAISLRAQSPPETATSLRALV